MPFSIDWSSEWGVDPIPEALGSFKIEGKFFNEWFQNRVFCSMNWMLTWPVFVGMTVIAALALAAAFLRRRPAGAGCSRQDKMLADVAEKAPVSLLQVGADGIIQWANRAELELLGYSRQEYVGRKAAEFYADPS